MAVCREALGYSVYGMAKTFLKDLNTDRYVCFDDKKYNYDKANTSQIAVY